MKNKNASSIGWCEPCGKHYYLTRGAAKAIARRHPSHKAVYRCKTNDNFWHVGELDPLVIRGVYGRGEFYRRAS